MPTWFQYLFTGAAITAFMTVAGSTVALIGTGYSWYRAAKSEQESAEKKVKDEAKAEADQRTAILTQLRQEYILSHDGISPRIAAGLELPPTDWVNKRLRELNIPWQLPPPSQAAKTSDPIGSIQLALHLDRRSGPDIAFHLTAINISRGAVAITRVTFTTGFVIDVEIEKNRNRALPPGGQIDYPGLTPNHLAVGKRLSATVQYERPDLAEPNEFSSHFEFLVREDADVGRAINPHEWYTQLGNIEEISGPTPRPVTALALPRGAMLLSLLEVRPDGAPNLTILNGSNRSFRFDPSSRTVEFSVIYDGRPLSISTKIPPLPPGRREHKVGFGWSDEERGINMAIDGLPAVSSPGFGGDPQP